MKTIKKMWVSIPKSWVGSTPRFNCIWIYNWWSPNISAIYIPPPTHPRQQSRVMAPRASCTTETLYKEKKSKSNHKMPWDKMMTTTFKLYYWILLCRGETFEEEKKFVYFFQTSSVVVTLLSVCYVCLVHIWEIVGLWLLSVSGLWIRLLAWCLRAFTFGFLWLCKVFFFPPFLLLLFFKFTFHIFNCKCC